MKTPLCFTVWTLVLFSRLFEISEAVCGANSCTVTLTTTTTNINIFQPNDCTITIKEKRYQTSIIPDLVPGAVYNVSFNCSDCCTDQVVTTKPEKVMDLKFTEVTTSSLNLSWTKPSGNVSEYSVNCSNGITRNGPETFVNITELTSGEQYTVEVTAVALDGKTTGEPARLSQFTKPQMIQNLTVTVTTSSMYVNWTKPEGQSSSYTVKWTDGNQTMTNTVKDTFINITNLSAGMQYTLTVSAVAADGSTSGDGTSTKRYTKPGKIKFLNVSATLNTITIFWDKPDGQGLKYKSVANTVTKTSEATSVEFSTLMPGTNYTISVTAIAGDNVTEGEPYIINTVTRPAKPVNITAKAVGTDRLSIGWALPEGSADYYIVNIINKSETTNSSSVTVTGLSPGRVYEVNVTAVAGNFTNKSEPAFIATIPLPPESIIISETTNSSLHMYWGVNSQMAVVPNISYNITYKRSGDSDTQSKNSMVNETTLSSLDSGTLYNIIVKTVGPQNLHSFGANTTACTNPNPVLNLVASPESNTSVKVTWSYPQDTKSNYTYTVLTYNANGELINNKSVQSNTTTVEQLGPGTKYNITVFTVADPNCKSTKYETSSFTKPNAVTNLTVTYVSTTAIQITWLRPSDYKPTYRYLVQALQDKGGNNQLTKTENYTFNNLTPGEVYTLSVVTDVEGVQSEKQMTSGQTRPKNVTITEVRGSTTNLSVSWDSVTGKVDSFTVFLYSGSQLTDTKSDLSNTTQSTFFTGLKPGVWYCAIVATNCGYFQNNSSSVCNATFPNPPGRINVTSQTNHSVNFTWALPQDMNPNQYNFSVTTFNRTCPIQYNYFMLEALESGSPYSITVVTVVVYESHTYQSQKVTTEAYTRPNAVTGLRQTQITTNTVTLEWTQPEYKSYYSFLVVVSNNSNVTSENVTNLNYRVVTGLQSGTNYSFTVTTRTADGTKASPNTVSYFTRPYNIKGLQTKTLNTTSVQLNWTQSLEYKPEYTYLVVTSGCSFPKNQTLKENSVIISDLTPGTNCSFCVSVKAENGIEGASKCTSQYTMPEKVHPGFSSQGNSSMMVSWEKPPGNIESYTAYLSGSTTNLTSGSLNSSSLNYTFNNLGAGRLYTVTVVTQSGPFNVPSDSITNATFPNPPGDIEILNKTTSSIEMRWGEAPLMSGASFYYRLEITSGRVENTTRSDFKFEGLVSGTSYNISVTSVAAMDWKSETVWKNLVTTKPFSVTALRASPNMDNVTLSWAQPVEYKSSYTYNLILENSNIIQKRANTSSENYTFVQLSPGTSYTFHVTTQTSDGTQGDPTKTSSCTNASPVQNLRCYSPNEPVATITLVWENPSGLYSNFMLNVLESPSMSSTSRCCNYTFNKSLKHYTNYSLEVITQSCGAASTAKTIACQTGITNPPIPADYKSMLNVVTKEFNKFTIEIRAGLLNDTNGPITNIGVLVTDNTNGLDKLSMQQYVTSTYNQWKLQNTPLYLATIKDNVLQSRSATGTITIPVGDETQWKDYLNGVLEATRQYQYAIVVFTSLTLNGNLINGQTSLFSLTDFYNTVILPQNPAVIGLAVGVTLGIFCFLLIILIGFIIYWRRLSKKETSDIQIHSMRAKVSAPVRVEDYEVYYKKQKADSNCGFAEEFEDLKVVGTAQAKTNALNPENKPKNRYNNVLPYDSSRVKLSIIHGNPVDDYINANYIPGYHSRKEFIAAQGPLPATVNDFWRMVWEKNIHTLVMLTRCNEQGRVKCEQYWTPGTKHFGNITVTTTSEIPLEDWTIRDFDIKNVKTAETRSVRHFHFTAWPDHGVPETTELLISFRHLVREHMDQYRHCPTVVHCSAGVGRTGTFITIDRLIFQIERENVVDIFGIVHDLRMHRCLMVQTEDQYVFLNQCAIDIIRSRTGTNVDLIYQNTDAFAIYQNIEPRKAYHQAPK